MTVVVCCIMWKGTPWFHDKGHTKNVLSGSWTVEWNLKFITVHVKHSMQHSFCRPLLFCRVLFMERFYLPHRICCFSTMGPWLSVLHIHVYNNIIIIYNIIMLALWLTHLVDFKQLVEFSKVWPTNKIFGADLATYVLAKKIHYKSQNFK